MPAIMVREMKSSSFHCLDGFFARSIDPSSVSIFFSACLLEGLVDPIAAAPAATAAAVAVYLFICPYVCLIPVLQLLSSFYFLFLTTIFLTTTEPWLDLPSICLPISVCVRVYVWLSSSCVSQLQSSSSFLFLTTISLTDTEPWLELPSPRGCTA